MATHFSILAWSIHMNREAWWAIVHRVAKNWTRLSNFTFSPELELHFPIYNFKSKALESEKMAYIT